jgi:hypothetical protein
MNTQDIVMQNLKVMDVVKTISEWRKATVVEEPTQRENNRIPSKDVFGLPGSATGEHAMAILKAKEDARIAAATAAAA